MAGPIIMPPFITLPVMPRMFPGDAYRALGISRATAHARRQRNGFPAAGDDGRIETAALAARIVQNGGRVSWL